MNDLWPFEKPPRKVQLAALRQATGMSGFAYFMRQRMGKTGTLLADYELLRRSGLCDHLIAVVPNSLKYAWASAAKDEWGMTVPIFVYEAAKKESIIPFMRKHKQFMVIINYDSLANFVGYRYAFQYRHDRAMIAFDQSTEIKTHSAMRTKAALKLAHTHAYKRILAGKPSSNGNHDLWAQLKAIDAVGESFYAFRNAYSVMGGYMGKQIVGSANTVALKERMAPFTFIAGDEYLAEFEPRIYAPIRDVGMHKEQARVYKLMEKEFVAELSSGVITAPIVLTKYLRLQQISAGFAIDDDGKPHQIVPTLQNPRLMEVHSLIANECTNKVIVFARFKQSIEWLNARLAEFNPAIIVGGMEGPRLELEKAKFNESDDCKVLIAQIDVAKMGHTLPGPDHMPCDTIIFYENTYSLITRSEAEARPEIMGRKIPIEVIDICSSPMDKAVISAIRSKEDAAMALMDYARKYGVLSNVG